MIRFSCGKDLCVSSDERYLYSNVRIFFEFLAPYSYDQIATYACNSNNNQRSKNESGLTLNIILRKLPFHEELTQY